MRTAFLFPGQGCQTVGMGKPFFDKFAYVRDIYEEIGEMLGIDFPALCFEGPAKELNRTIYAQPAIFATSLAAFRVFVRETGIEPAVCCGHSMGEITALTAAGAIAVPEALELIRVRGRLMEDCAGRRQGAMTAVMTVDPVSLQELCWHIAQELGLVLAVSNYNSTQQSVVSGDLAAIQALETKLESRGIRSVRLKTSGAFHCLLMKDASDAFRQVLDRYIFHSPAIPVLSNMSGDLYSDQNNIPDILSQQILSPVRWKKCMESIRRYADQAVDVSPNGVLRRFMGKDDIPCVHFRAIGQLQDFRDLPDTPPSGVMNPSAAEAFLKRCIVAAISVKNSNFDNRQYESQVITPYRELESMLKEVKAGAVLDREGREAVLSRVYAIFQHKILSDDVQKAWMDELAMF